MLQESVGNRKLAPISEGSKKAGDRLFELRENRPQIDLLDLSLGNKLELAFFDIEGNKISTSSLGIDYTLVDFCASHAAKKRQQLNMLCRSILIILLCMLFLLTINEQLGREL